MLNSDHDFGNISRFFVLQNTLSIIGGYSENVDIELSCTEIISGSFVNLVSHYLFVYAMYIILFQCR